MVLDGDDIVFATNSQIASNGVVYRVPRSGGDATAIYRDLGADAALAIDNGRVIVADSGQAGHCSLKVGGGSILSIDPTGDVSVRSRRRTCARDLTPHASGLFWIDNLPSEPNAFGLGMFLPLGESADAEATGFPDSDFTFSSQLLLVDQTLVWSSGESIFSMPVGEQTPTTIAAVPRPNVRFATGAGKIAFQTYSPPGSTEDIAVLEVRGLFDSQTQSMRLPFGTFEAPRLQIVDDNFVYMTKGNDLWVADPIAQAIRRLATLDLDFIPDDQILLQDDLFLYALTREGNATRIVRIRKPATALLTVDNACQLPLQECGGESCADTSVDPANCGECGDACATGEICEQSQCTCLETCDGACVDLMTDSQNCGTCGNVCLEDCIGGACDPFGVALGEIAPVAVPTVDAQGAVQDAFGVYFQDGSDLKHLDKETFAVSVLRESTVIKSLAVDDAQLYTLETAFEQVAATVNAVSLDGQTVTPLYVDRPDPTALIAAADVLVWMENAGHLTSTPLPATLAVGAKDGSALDLVTPVGLYSSAGADRARAVTTDGTVAYWLVAPEDPDLQPCRTTASIIRVDLTTSPPTTSLLAQIPGQPAGAISVLDDKLYIATCDRNDRSSDFTMFEVPKTGGSPRKIATLDLGQHSGDQSVSLSFDTSGGRLRWIDGGRTVRELDPVLETPRTVASDLLFAGHVFDLDDGFLVAAGNAFFFVPEPN